MMMMMKISPWLTGREDLRRLITHSTLERAV